MVGEPLSKIVEGMQPEGMNFNGGLSDDIEKGENEESGVVCDDKGSIEPDIGK